MHESPRRGAYHPRVVDLRRAHVGTWTGGRWIPITLRRGAAASPGVDLRGALLAGAGVGTNDHVHDDGPKFDLHLGAELQVWRLILGGTLGHDSYGKADGAPISALTTAVHLGATAPLFGWQHHGRLREIRARAALELGLHSYSPSGRESDVQLELVGRRDRDPVRLAYTVESCGGLLRDDDE